ncbi:MAG: four helix bundle protein, partial [Bacteroidetes bacterium]|nr:four helix bundle protein [Bacteroidota bacterium]
LAVGIVSTSRRLTEEKREYVLSKQLLRSGTSIGANIAEANGGISKADFSAKLSISYKESLETKYWLDLLKETGLLDAETHGALHRDADEVSRILYSILRTTRIQQQQ